MKLLNQFSIFYFPRSVSILYQSLQQKKKKKKEQIERLKKARIGTIFQSKHENVKIRFLKEFHPWYTEGNIITFNQTISDLSNLQKAFFEEGEGTIEAEYTRVGLQRPNNEIIIRGGAR